MHFRELYSTNVIYPVCDALNDILSEMLNYEVLKKANYRFVVRPQQKQMSGTCLTYSCGMAIV